jgi:two-component system NtrC family sensor kinase
MLDPQLYTKKITPEEYNNHLDIILNSVFRCRDITGKLLGFVRKDEVKLQSENVNEILQEVIRMMQNEIMISNITVESDFDENLPEIYTNRNQLQQVFINIINNAIAATTTPGRIFFRTMMKGEFIDAVTDTGWGCPEQIEKFSFPFILLNRLAKVAGLAVYGIIKTMCGRIEVNSEVGRGSTFEVLLPFQKKS